MGGGFCCVKIHQKRWTHPPHLTASLLKWRRKIMYAVIQTGGKQYKVQVGDVLYVEKLSVEADEIVKFDTVLAFEDENGIQVGTPTLDIPVEAKVLKNGKGKKVTVFTYKPKKNEKRKLGHRQPYTKIEITSINGVANA
jgi:large subunit ribosomal protein L21